MSDLLAGALCVLAAMSAGPRLRSRALLLVGAAGVVACAADGGAPAVVGGLLALVASFVASRSGRVGSTLPASMQASLVTVAFVAWLMPDAFRLNGASAVLAGGAIAALGWAARVRANGTTRRDHAGNAPLHLAAAGACAALAYALGAQPGALAVVAVIAMIVLIGAHLSLALGGGASAPLASVMSGAAACGLAVVASSGALAVACVTLAIGCAQTASFAGIAREAP
jgi:hypothetical protein